MQKYLVVDVNVDLRDVAFQTRSFNFETTLNTWPYQGVILGDHPDFQFEVTIPELGNSIFEVHSYDIGAFDEVRNSVWWVPRQLSVTTVREFDVFGNRTTDSSWLHSYGVPSATYRLVDIQPETDSLNVLPGFIVTRQEGVSNTTIIDARSGTPPRIETSSDPVIGGEFLSEYSYLVGAFDTLFTNEDDVVDFNNLSTDQLSAVQAGAYLYHASDGDDVVFLPTPTVASELGYSLVLPFFGGLGGDTIDATLVGPDQIIRLLGGEGDDSLFGSPGTDFLNGGPDNDIFVGSGGDDTAILSGDGLEYTFFLEGPDLWSSEGPDGSDTYASIEFYQFDNITIDNNKLAEILMLAPEHEAAEEELAKLLAQNKIYNELISLTEEAIALGQEQTTLLNWEQKIKIMQETADALFGVLSVLPGTGQALAGAWSAATVTGSAFAEIQDYVLFDIPRETNYAELTLKTIGSDIATDLFGTTAGGLTKLATTVWDVDNDISQLQEIENAYQQATSDFENAVVRMESYLNRQSDIQDKIRDLELQLRDEFGKGLGLPKVRLKEQPEEAPDVRSELAAIDVPSKSQLGFTSFDTVSGTLTTFVSASLDQTQSNITMDGLADIDGTGNDLDNTLTGNDGDNTLNAMGGDDSVFGNGGEDIIIAATGAGNDFYDGGEDNDTIVFTSATEDIEVNLEEGTASGPEIDTDTIVNVENIVAGSGNDTLTGNDKNNVIEGGAGDDVIDGKDGQDVSTYQGNRADFVIMSLSDGSIQVEDTNTEDGDEGIDTLSNIEFLRFSDATIPADGNSQNQFPNANDEDITTNEDTPLSGNVLDNDTDPDGDTLTVTAVNGEPTNVGQAITLASGALLTLNTDGSFSYDPNGAFEDLNDGQTDSDSFTYTISDGNDGESSATVNVLINGITDDSEPAVLSLTIEPDTISENNGVASATISRTGDTSTDLTVELTSDDETEAVVPASVIIPAGSPLASFDVTAQDDDDVDGTQTTTIIASALGFESTFETIEVSDDDVPAAPNDLQIGIFDSETDELITLIEDGQRIDNDFIADHELTVAALVPHDSTFSGNVSSMRLDFNYGAVTRVENVEPYALFGDKNSDFAGQSNLFSLGDNMISFDLYSANRLKGDFLGTVTRNFTIVDEDVPELSLDLTPSSISEDGGVATANVSRTGDLSSPLEVSLISSDTSEATVPSNVIIAADSASTDFDVLAVDDFIVDGTQTATISASAQNFASASDSLSVTDNDVPQSPEGLIIGLYDSEKDTLVKTLTNGTEVLASETVGLDLTIVGTVADDSDMFADAESLFLNLNDGAVTRTENVEPYALFGDINHDFSGRENIFDLGNNTIAVDVYDADRLAGNNLGSVTIEFSFIDDLA